MSGDVPRHLVVVALELLEVGDLPLATEVLLDALEDGEAYRGKGFAPTHEPRCEVCGARAWPGDYARHIYSAHRAAEELDVAA